MKSLQNYITESIVKKPKYSPKTYCIICPLGILYDNMLDEYQADHLESDSNAYGFLLPIDLVKKEFADSFAKGDCAIYPIPAKYKTKGAVRDAWENGELDTEEMEMIKF